MRRYGIEKEQISIESNLNDAIQEKKIVIDRSDGAMGKGNESNENGKFIDIYVYCMLPYR